ncbi:MAG TPA: phosphopantetheine-binding protein [Thermoanaerobaculia bacterium]|nr:phosphopantetheine-binding protein [Thermoanaerobaculia bacterium]
MTREEIEKKVLVIIHDQKTLPPDSISKSTLLAEAGIDSLDALSILFELEESFDISIPDDRAKEIRTMDDMVSAIEEQLPASS